MFWLLLSFWSTFHRRKDRVAKLNVHKDPWSQPSVLFANAVLLGRRNHEWFDLDVRVFLSDHNTENVTAKKKIALDFCLSVLVQYVWLYSRCSTVAGACKLVRNPELAAFPPIYHNTSPSSVSVYASSPAGLSGSIHLIWCNEQPVHHYQRRFCC